MILSPSPPTPKAESKSDPPHDERIFQNVRGAEFGDENVIIRGMLHPLYHMRGVGGVKNAIFPVKISWLCLFVRVDCFNG